LQVIAGHTPITLSHITLSLTHTQEEFLENLSAAAAALQSAVPQVLEFVAGKKVSEL
jgi:hypothetical protein